MTKDDEQSHHSHAAEPTDGNARRSGSEPAAPSAATQSPAGEPDAATAEPGPAGDVFSKTPWRRPSDGAVLRATLDDALNVCSSCNSPVPLGARRCANCEKWVRGNPGKKSPKAAMDHEHAALVDEYRPQTPSLKAFCRELARAHVELRSLPLGSSEWQRTMSTAQELAATLEASRPSRLSTAAADLSTLSIFEQADRAEAIAKQFRDEANRAAEMAPPIIERRPASSDDVHEPVETPRAPSASTCSYCKKPDDECAVLRTTHVDWWRAVHDQHPDEVERRQKEATATMLHQIGRPLPDWYRR